MLSGLGAGGGVLGVSALVPATWIKPVVDAVILPTHAQPSPPGDGGGDPAPEVRGAPTSVTAVVLSDESGLSVTWDAAPTGVDSYTVRYRRSSDSGSEFRADVATVAADAPSLTHTFTFPQGEAALQAGDTFTVEVRAVYGQSGTQAATEHEATDATPAFVPEQTDEQRGAPTNVSATLSGTSGVSVAWSAAPVGVDRYTLRYRKGTEQYRTGSGDTATIQADAARTHVFTFPAGEAALLPGDTFTVEVTAVYDASGTQAATTHPATDVTPAFGQEQRGAPTNVMATLSGTSGVSVTWGAAPVGVDEYTLRYRRSSDSGSGFRAGVGTTATVAADATLEHTFTLPGNEAALLPGDTFTVEVRAVYEQSGTQTATEHEATDVTPAVADEQRGAPTNMSATLSSTTGVRVTWSAAPVGVDEYTLRYRRSSDSGSGFRTGADNTATVAADATLAHTFTLPVTEADLLPGDTFTVEVTAVYEQSGTQTATEHEATATTPAFGQEQRGAPVNVSATLSVTSGVTSGVRVTWDAAPSGVDEYTLRYQRGTAGYRTGDANTATVEADATLEHTFTLPAGEADLLPGDTFTVEVAAVYEQSGTQGRSERTATATTSAVANEQRGAPTNVSATLSGTSGVRVTWDTAPTGVDEYSLRYQRGTAGYRTGDANTATVEADATLEHTFTLPAGEADLLPGDTFTIEVAAVYEQSGTQVRSERTATATTSAVANEQRGAPTNVSATLSGTSGVRVTWDAAPVGVDEYSLRYQKGSDGYRSGSANTATVEVGATLEHTFTLPSDEGLLPGDTFTVEVTAVYEQSGTQVRTTHPETATTSAVADEQRGAPTNVSATLSGTTGVRVTWGAALGGVDRYTLRYQRGTAGYRTGDTNTATVAADAALEHVFTLPGNEATLQAGDTFTVEVTAVYDASGTQARSEHAATGATPAFVPEEIDEPDPGAPTKVTATYPSESSGINGIDIAWDVPTAPGRSTLEGYYFRWSRNRADLDKLPSGGDSNSVRTGRITSPYVQVIIGQQADDRYYVLVRALYDDEDGSDTVASSANTILVNTGEEEETDEQRGVPTSVTATLSGTSGVRVTWGAAPVGVDRYTLRYQKGSEGYRTASGTTATVQAGATLAHTFTFPEGEAERVPGDTFTVEVRAVYDANGTQAASTHPATDATPAVANEQRGAPTSVVATLSGTSGVRVTWGAAPTGVDRYTLRYRKGTAAYRTGSDNIATVATNAARTHTFTFPAGEAALQAGDTFTVEVTAVYDANGTQVSSTHAATDATPAFVPEETNEPGPGAPTNVVTTRQVQNLQARITWDAPSNPPSAVQGYFVRLSRNRADLNTIRLSNTNFGTISRVNASIRVESDNFVPALTTGQQYFGLVRALYDDEDGSDTVASSPNTVVVASDVAP